MTTFIILAVTALLWGATLAPLNLLSLALSQSGMTAHDIGLVIAASNVAGIVAAFLAGPTIERIGPKRALLVAFSMAFVGIVTLQYWSYNTTLAALSSFVRGCGGGFFLVSGVIITRNTSPPDQQIYRVGLYTSFVMLPTLVIPALAQRYLSGGTQIFYILSALPALVAIPFIFSLPNVTPNKRQLAPTPYRTLLADRRIRLPCFMVGVTGVMYAFNTGFLALYMEEQLLAVAAFFSPFVVLLLLSRFVFMRKLQTLSIMLLINMGMGFYTVPYFILPIPTIVTAILAGAAFGMGYSIVYPSSMEWLCQQFDKDDQPKLVSLINTSFQTGNVVGALIVGFTVVLVSWGVTMLLMGLLGLVAIGMLAWAARPEKAAAFDIP